MRTTLDIADDVLLAAKELAKREKKSLGQIISDLARSAVSPPAADADSASQASDRLAAFGIYPLPARGGIVSNELIDHLRGAEGI